MILNSTGLEKIRQDFAGKKIVFSDGTFDLLHAVHVDYLRSLREYGDILVVGVMSDDWVRMRKGDTRPVMKQTERLHLLDAIRYVDYTVLLYDEGKKQRIKTSEVLALLRPDIFVTVDTIWNERTAELEGLGVELRLIPRTPAAKLLSTTVLIQRILDAHKPQSEA